MSRVRTSVEWVFGGIVNYFAFLDFKKNLKIQLNAVGEMYSVCALLTIVHTCLYQSMTSSYFGIEPPQLNEYFTWTQNKERTFYEMFIFTNVFAKSLYTNEKYTFLEKNWAIFFREFILFYHIIKKL